VGIVVYEDTEKYERIELQSSFLLRKAEENGSPAVKIGLKVKLDWKDFFMVF